MSSQRQGGELAEVLARLQGVKQSARGWTALCPAHDDHNPSLSVAIGDDSRVLLKCHRGCGFESIVAALGMSPADLAPPAEPHRSSHASSGLRSAGRTWPSLDAAAAALEQMLGAGVQLVATYLYRENLAVLRFEKPSGEKTFRPVNRQGTSWRVGDPPGLWPLYRLAEIASAAAVYVCEGEKACEAAAALGLPATTSAHGADSAAKTDWSPLVGNTVYVLKDNDTAGLKYARDVATILVGLSPPAVVQIVSLPGLPEHGDIVDFIAARTAAGCELDAIRAEVERLSAGAPPFVGPGGAGPGQFQQLAQGFGGLAGAQRGSQDSWPEAEPLPDPLRPVEPFELDLLPAAFRPWIGDISERMQCPPDYAAITAMVSLAAIVGRRIGIRPKRHDDWLVVANLWGAAVGRPGVLKSPAMQEGLRPIRGLESDARTRFEAETKGYSAQQMVRDAKQRAGRKDIEQALKGKGDPLELALGMVNDGCVEPVRTRFIVNDSTVEKLGEIQNENPNGILAYRDELVGLLLSLEKDGQEGARAYYLEAWNGTGSYTYDRIGRGTIDIKSTTLSLLGSIQPGRLLAYLNGAMQMGGKDDGLLQRIQLLVWPDVSREWTNHDRAPDHAARERADAVFRNIVARSGVELGGRFDERGSSDIPYLRFDDAAQPVFDEWLKTLELRIRTGTEHPAFESHIAKYRSLLPSIALLVHLADGHGHAIDLGCLERALGWVRYLESHATRLYSLVAAPERSAADHLAKRILRGDIKDGFGARDVYQKDWAGLNSPALVAAATEFLADLGWLRKVVHTETGGANRTTWSINPQILERAREGTSKTDKSAGTSRAVLVGAEEGTGKTPTSAPTDPAESHEAQPGTGKTPTTNDGSLPATGGAAAADAPDEGGDVAEDSSDEWGSD